MYRTNFWAGNVHTTMIHNVKTILIIIDAWYTQEHRLGLSTPLAFIFFPVSSNSLRSTSVIISTSLWIESETWSSQIIIWNIFPAAQLSTHLKGREYFSQARFHLMEWRQPHQSHCLYRTLEVNSLASSYDYRTSYSASWRATPWHIRNEPSITSPWF